MSQRYPCPNPVCLHEFAAADLAAASVTCPMCGMVIQLRAAPATPSVPPAATVALPRSALANVPMALPVQSVPMARAVAPAEPAAAPDAVVAPIVRARRSKSRDWLTYGLLFGFILMMGGLGIVGLLVHDRGGFGGLFNRGGYKNSDFNFNFDPQVRGWERSEAMKSTLLVSQLALARSAAPNGYFAIDAIDYRDRTPSVHELDDEARKKLQAMFPKSLETDPGPDSPVKTAEKIAGQATHQFAFRGEDNEKVMSGSVAFFGHQGIGYWFYSLVLGEGAPELDREFADLRDSFKLLGERADWTIVQKQRHPFPGDKVKGYQLVDTSGRWKKDEDPTAHDPKADLVLHALDSAQPKRPVLGADVIVMSLELADDAVEAARQHILEKHERDAFPSTKIGDAGEAKDQVGSTKGHLLRWRVNNGGGRERFAVVGIVPRDGDMLVIYGECAWERRFNWELQLQQIVESLELKD